jgi:hypothetical protein
MNPVGFRGQGHIQTIIDDKGHPCSSAYGLHLAGNPDHLLGRSGFLAILDGVGPSDNGQFGKILMGEMGLKEDIGQNMKPSNFFQVGHHKETTVLKPNKRTLEQAKVQG